MANLNNKMIANLGAPEKGNKLYWYAGDAVGKLTAPSGFGVRVTAAGAKSFVLNYRVSGRECRFTIGKFPTWDAEAAVREANKLRQRIDRGGNPLDDRAPAPTVKTVASVLDDFMERHVRGKLRSEDDYQDAFERLVKPRIGKLSIYEVRRSHIVEMLDQIADESGRSKWAQAGGGVMADRTLSYLRAALNWYAVRDDNFVMPVVRGMARTKAQERAGTRILSDEEIRAIWPALDACGNFGKVVKLLLFTGQRRFEIAHMAWSEIGADGVWAIPAERYKTKRPHFVPLSRPAFAIVQAQPRTGALVFPSAVNTKFSGFATHKAALDRKVMERNSGRPLAPWRLHDLRRTSRSLMSRAGVRPDIAERVLGHVIVGVEGVYDRHSYLDEKRAALETLAAMVDRILNPTSNVLPLARVTA